ncbi:chorismate mutase [Pseudomonas sp. 148P]|uniref:chorismate mutase n=1 Tax=Pseudomonas ulcerans TaxID=3115852 RepID=A0ABU7HVC4_9PSED|nr:MULTISPECIES: chorismate mutase [unclassified Pseudomonas]MEE1923547.1 chorismate mutase [Pseudomonas sp. 147P]MEE1935386.1 chorismate mutase [Pseudomonas sp. 148P]
MSSPPPSFQETLGAYRQELDVLDEQIVALLAKRFAVTQKVGELNAMHAVEPVDNAREAAQLERLTELSRQYGLPDATTRAIFETVIGLVRDNHRDIARAREHGVS